MYVLNHLSVNEYEKLLGSDSFSCKCHTPFSRSLLICDQKHADQLGLLVPENTPCPV